MLLDLRNHGQQMGTVWRVKLPNRRVRCAAVYRRDGTLHGFLLETVRLVSRPERMVARQEMCLTPEAVLAVLVVLTAASESCMSEIVAYVEANHITL